MIGSEPVGGITTDVIEAVREALDENVQSSKVACATAHLQWSAAKSINFHERTPEQGRRDSSVTSRDRALIDAAFPVLRFTGRRSGSVHMVDTRRQPDAPVIALPDTAEQPT
ncbi:MAG: hypothetical protein HYV09_36620 [Deltaproteobacteria bacterium]|nr:hypothetical protein [Deltaproteobacteria bacterium]